MVENSEESKAKALTPKEEKPPKEVVKDLTQEIKEEFNKRSTEDGEKAKKYLEAKPEKPVEKQQNTKLIELNQVILDNPNHPLAQRVVPTTIVQKTQEATVELAGNNNEAVFQQSFFTELSALSVSEDVALPYARLVVKMAVCESNTPEVEGNRKIKDAFQILLSEAGKTPSTKKLLFETISAILDSHFDLESMALKDKRELARSVQELAQHYGLTNLETRNLITPIEIPRSSGGRRVETTPAKELAEEKNSIFDGFTTKEQKIIDLYILSLTPELIKTMAKEPDKIEETIDLLVQDAITNGNLSLSSEKLAILRSRVGHYFGIVGGDIRRNYEVEARKNTGLGAYGFYPPDSFSTAVDNWDNSYVAAFLMFNTLNTFYVKEYMRGKVKNPLVREVEKSPGILDGNRHFELTEQDLEKYLFEDMQRMYFLSRRGGDRQSRGNSLLNRFYSGVTNAIDIVRDDDEIDTKALFLGLQKHDETRTEANQITFMVKESTEDMGGVLPLKRSTESATSKAVDLLDTFTKQTRRLEKVLGSLEQASEQMKSGELEGALKTAGDIQNKDLDFIIRKAPAIMAARSAYMRAVKQKLAENRGILTADFFKEKSVGMTDIDSDANNDFCAAYWHLSTAEQDLYYDAGKAMAIADGDFLFLLADALPDNNFLLDGTLPPEVLEKIQRGEPLGQADLTLVRTAKFKSPRDFPFRGILNQINYLKWLDQWAVGEPYKLDMLGTVPWVSNQGELEPYDMFVLSQKIDRALYTGCNDETVRYFQEDVIIPSVDLNKLIPNMSIAQRAGWRVYLQNLLRDDFVRVWDESKGMVVKVDETVDLLLRRAGPMVAYNFVMHGGTSEYVNKNQGMAPEKKKAMLLKIVQYCRLYHPTIFLINEKRHLFRETEQSFNDTVKNHVLEDLRRRESSVYNVFLSEKEKGEQAFELRPSVFDPPEGAGRDYPIEATQAQEVYHRMIDTLQAAETFISTNKPLPEAGKIASEWSLREFFRDMAVNPNNEDPKYADLKKTVMRKLEYHQGRRSLKPELEGRKEMFKAFVTFANKVFYEEQNSADMSIYGTGRFLGITQLPENYVKRRKEILHQQIETKKKMAGDPSSAAKYKSTLNALKQEWDALEAEIDLLKIGEGSSARSAKQGIESYFTQLILTKRIINPFDFTYYDNPQLDLQMTGLTLFKRNIADFEGLVGFYKLIPTIVTKQTEIIKGANKEESKKALKGITDEIGKALRKVSGAYGAAAAYKCGWFAYNYAQRPFIPSRLRDAVLIGVAPFINSWATLMNPNDVTKQNCFDLGDRKEEADHAKNCKDPVISDLTQNEMVTGLTDTVEVVLPFVGENTRGGKKKPIEIKLPKWFAKHIMPVLKKEDLDGMKGKDLFDFTYESVMKNNKIDFKWRVFTIFTTVTLIGILLITMEAIREGMKEAEIK